MTSKKLKLNFDKPENKFWVLVSTSAIFLIQSEDVAGNVSVSIKFPVWKLDVKFISSLAMVSHANELLHQLHVYNPTKTNRFTCARNCPIEIMVTKMLCGVLDKQIIFQASNFMNNAARLVALTKKIKHMTPAMAIHQIPDLF